jgi:ABC-2 type transport system permease protein
MSMKHLWAVTRKEIRHIFRDKGTLVLVGLTPTLLLLLLAYALLIDFKHVPIAVLDYDRSQTSRQFIDQIVAGDALDLYQQVSSLQEIDNLLTRGAIKAAIIISPDFSRQMLGMEGIPLEIIIDGTEPQGGEFAIDQISGRAEAYVTARLAKQGALAGITGSDLQPLELRVQAWYNPGLKSSVDLVPGLISLVLGLPGMSIALTLAREREHGTLEQLLATPVGRAELLVGKMIPYVISGLLNVLLTTALALYWFKVPFRGNFGLFFVLSAVFLFAVLSMGMIIGVFIKTQAASLALSMLVILFPGFFLTGIFFPLASMPAEMRTEALSLPGTHFAIITRGSYITGVGLATLWPYAVALLAMFVGYTTLAALFFRKKLG